MIEDTKKYLILKGCAGLGNRLITLCNAIKYARRNNRILFVDWSDGQFGKKGENIFYKYFDLVNVPHIKSWNEIENWENKTKYPVLWGENKCQGLYELYEASTFSSPTLPLSGRYRGKFSKLNAAWVVKSKTKKQKQSRIASLLDKNSLPLGGNYLDRIREDIVFFADFCPNYDTSILHKNIKLESSLKKEIIDIVARQKLAKSTIGIHIRSTDKKPNVSISKIDDLIDSIGKEKKIFLATDNKFVRNEFSEKHENLIHSDTFLPENQNEGLHQWALYNNESNKSESMFRESILDMWLLSECEYLLYQGNSSFSRISKVLHKNKNKCFDWSLSI